MTLSIGRCSGLRPGPGSPTREGDRLVYAGTIVTATAEELMVRRQQLLGYVGNVDEEVVPVAGAVADNIDGYYRVLSASVQQIGPNDSTRARFSCTLQAITRRKNPTFDVTLQSVARSGHPSKLTGLGAIVAAAPDVPQFSDWDMRPSFGATPTFTRVGSFDSVGGDPATLGLWTANAPQALTSYRWSGDVGYYYAFSCKLEWQYGSTWYPVVGLDLPARTGRWRIANGLVRLTAGNSADSVDPYSTLEVFNNLGEPESRRIQHMTRNTATSSWVYHYIGEWSPSFTADTPAVTVLRNSPEEVSVMVTTNSGEVVYTLARGARFVTGAWSRAPSSWTGITLDPSQAADGTDFTYTVTPPTPAVTVIYGVRVTSDDPNGNRLVFSQLPNAMETGQPGATNTYAVTTTVRPSGIWMAGVEYNGSSAATNDTAEALLQQFAGQAQWRQRVVQR